MASNSGANGFSIVGVIEWGRLVDYADLVFVFVNAPQKQARNQPSTQLTRHSSDIELDRQLHRGLWLHSNNLGINAPIK